MRTKNFEQRSAIRQFEGNLVEINIDVKRFSKSCQLMGQRVVIELGVILCVVLADILKFKKPAVVDRLLANHSASVPLHYLQPPARLRKT